MLYSHRGCGAVVAEYVGKGKPKLILSADWKVFGVRPEFRSSARYLCPKCNKYFQIERSHLEETNERDESLWKYALVHNPSLAQVKEQLKTHAIKQPA